MVDIKKLRFAREMTQTELAKRAGVKVQLVSMLEHGKRKPTIGTAKALAPHLGVDWTDFFK